MPHPRIFGQTDSEYEAQHDLKDPTGKQGAGERLQLGEGDTADIIAQYMLGQRFQAVRRADGSIIVLDRSTGEPKRNLNADGSIGRVMVLSPAAPADPTKPDISFHHDPNRGTYFALDNNTLVVTVISEETPEVQRGFQYVMEAEQTIANAGLDPSKYDYIYEDGRVVPVLTEDVPPDTPSFFTATAANGQLLAVSRLTGTATNLGDAPIAARVPTDATVEIDEESGLFKITDRQGEISFFKGEKEIEEPTEIEIGGQKFAFNPNTGGFQQVQQPAARFDPTVVTIGDRQFIRDPDGRLTPLAPEVTPGVVTAEDGRQFTQDTFGRLTPLDRQFDPGVVTSDDGRQFIQAPDGTLTALDREFNPGVVVIDDRKFIQDTRGNLQPLGAEAVPDLNELINTRIIAGDGPGALALADFRDRPTSLEAFNAAMQFAQSPGDVAAISAISRGQTLVAPPPSGTVQRIAEVPQFLQDSFNRLMNQFRGGTGTPGEFMNVLQRISQENDDSKKALSASEELVTTLQDKNKDLNLSYDISKAVAAINGGAPSAASDAAAAASAAAAADPAAAAAAQEDASGLSWTYDKETGWKFDAAEATTKFQKGNLGDPEFDFETATLAGRHLAQVQAEAEDRADKAVARERAENLAAAEMAGSLGLSAVGTTGKGSQLNLSSIGWEGIVTPEQLKHPGVHAMVSGQYASWLEAQKEEKEVGPVADPGHSRAFLPVTGGSSADQGKDSTIGPTDSGVVSAEVPDLGHPRAFLPVTGDSFAHGGVLDDNTAIVGEEGPELAILPIGTRIIDAETTKRLTKSKIQKLKQMGITGMQGGGVVDPLLSDIFGVRRALAGVTIEPTRRRLSRAAGLPVLSAQARQNLLPSELEVFNRLSREAKISEEDFAQEQRSAFPGANLARGRARFAPRVLR
jgi:hypothetical protein